MGLYTMQEASPSLRTLYKGHQSIWAFPFESQRPNFHLPKDRLTIDLADKSELKAETQTEALSTSKDVENGLLGTALLQYLAASVAMPWEVGKLLLQIQYVPQNCHGSEVEVDGSPELADEPHQEVGVNHYKI